MFQGCPSFCAYVDACFPVEAFPTACQLLVYVMSTSILEVYFPSIAMQSTPTYLVAINHRHR